MTMDNLVDQRKTQGNQSVEKAFQIIELLANEGEPMRLLDISKMLKVNSSTVLRFLTTLQKCGYVSQDSETAKYYLTYKFCGISNKINAYSSIRDLAAPYMKQLSKIFAESACLAVEQDMSVIYIYVVEGSDMMLRSMQRIGNIAPMHCTGIGKLLLTEYSDKQLDRLIETQGLKQFTEYTITDKTNLVSELNKIRQFGYAFDNEECELGARCIACPVKDHTGKIVAGVSITGPSHRLTDSFISDKLHHMIDLTKEISDKLGYKA